MKNKLIHRSSFRIIGICTRLSYDGDGSECTEFWDKAYNEKYSRLWQTMEPITAEERAICNNGIGTMAVLLKDYDDYEYCIAGEYRGGKIPEGMKTVEIPESDWMVFSAEGPLTESLPMLDAFVWDDWYPSQQEYEPSQDIEIHYYGTGDTLSPDFECSVWIPVKKISE